MLGGSPIAGAPIAGSGSAPPAEAVFAGVSVDTVQFGTFGPTTFAPAHTVDTVRFATFGPTTFAPAHTVDTVAMGTRRASRAGFHTTDTTHVRYIIGSRVLRTPTRTVRYDPDTDPRPRDAATRNIGKWFAHHPEGLTVALVDGQIIVDPTPTQRHTAERVWAGGRLHVLSRDHADLLAGAGFDVTMEVLPG